MEVEVEVKNAQIDYAKAHLIFWVLFWKCDSGINDSGSAWPAARNASAAGLQ
jgi:hypothetical protein